MLKFYHAPMSRSSSVLWLMEELGVPYEIELYDFRKATAPPPESYRAIQPNKKFPAIVHDGVAITERAAITTYLCDAFPQAGLAPPIGDPRRGPYLSWLVYCDSVIDPCFVAKLQGWTYEARGVGFGLFEDMVRHVTDTLTRQPYATGEAFTAADIQLGSAVQWGLDATKVLPETPALRAYVDRLQDRPGLKKAMAKGM